MKITNLSIDLIKKWEGFRSKPYLCPAGIPTIGYGTTVYPSGTKVKLTDQPITEKIATYYLTSNLEKFAIELNRILKVTLSEPRYNALLSMAYNIGVSSMKRSTLIKVVNEAPGSPGIRVEMMKWVKATDPKTKNKITLPGLVSRRKEEADLYFS